MTADRSARGAAAAQIGDELPRVGDVRQMSGLLPPQLCTLCSGHCRDMSTPACYQILIIFPAHLTSQHPISICRYRDCRLST